MDEALDALAPDRAALDEICATRLPGSASP
jgi:hypothetical protein